MKGWQAIYIRGKRPVVRLGLAGAGITEESSYLEVFIGERRSYS